MPFRFNIFTGGFEFYSPNLESSKFDPFKAKINILERTGPTASIVIEDPGTVYENLSVTVTATSTGTVTSVSLYADYGLGPELIGTDSGTPWSWDWTPHTSGPVTLSVKAYAGIELVAENALAVNAQVPNPELFFPGLVVHCWDTARSVVQVGGTLTSHADCVGGLNDDKLVVSAGTWTYTGTDTDFSGRPSIATPASDAHGGVLSCVGSATLSQPNVVVAVMRLVTPVSGTRYLWREGNPGADCRFLARGIGDKDYQLFNEPGGGSVDISAPVRYGAPLLLRVCSNGVASSVWEHFRGFTEEDPVTGGGTKGLKGFAFMSGAGGAQGKYTLLMVLSAMPSSDQWTAFCNWAYAHCGVQVAEDIGTNISLPEPATVAAFAALSAGGVDAIYSPDWGVRIGGRLTNISTDNAMVSVSGSNLSNQLGLTVEITGNGGLGVGTYRASFTNGDNGWPYSGTLAADIPLGGTGLTLHFEPHPYTTSMSYRANVAVHHDMTGVYQQSESWGRRWLGRATGWHGMPCLEALSFTPGRVQQSRGSQALAAKYSGVTKDGVFVVCAWDAGISPLQNIFTVSAATAWPNPRRFIQQSTFGGNQWFGESYDIAGASYIGPLIASLGHHQFALSLVSGVQHGYIDGTIVGTSAVAGTQTLDSLILGGHNLPDNPGYQWIGKVGMFVAYTADVDPAAVGTLISERGYDPDPTPEQFIPFSHVWEVGRRTVYAGGTASEQGDSITGLVADKLVQATGIYQPTIHLTDTDFGGHGSLENPTPNSSIRLTCAGSGAITQPYTRVFAVKHTSATLGYEVCGSASNNMIQRWTLNRWQFNAGGTAQLFETPTWQTTQAEVWYVYVNGASTTIEVVRADGTRVGPVTIPATAGAASWNGENWFSMTGFAAPVKIAFVGIVPGAITLEQQAAFEQGYLNPVLGFATAASSEEEEMDPVATLGLIDSGVTASRKSGIREVQSLRSRYSLSYGATDSIDSPYCLSSVAGRWIILPEGPYGRWHSTTTFYVDATAGNDEAVGDVTHPIRTLRQLEWRWATLKATNPLTVYLTGAFSETLSLTHGLAYGASLTVRGLRGAPLLTTTLASYTERGAGVNTREACICSLTGVADASIYAGRQLRISGGPRDGATAQIHEANPDGLGLAFVRTSQWVNAETDPTSRVTPVAGDTVVVDGDRASVYAINWNPHEPIGDRAQVLNVYDLKVKQTGVSRTPINAPSIWMRRCEVENPQVYSDWQAWTGNNITGTDRADFRAKGSGECDLFYNLVTPRAMVSVAHNHWCGNLNVGPTGGVSVRSGRVYWEGNDVINTNSLSGAVTVENGELNVKGQYGTYNRGYGNTTGVWLLYPSAIYRDNSPWLTDIITTGDDELNVMKVGMSWAAARPGGYLHAQGARYAVYG